MYIEYKAGQKHASKNAEMSEDHTYFKDAGWILNEDDLVVDIDCLDKEVIKIMLKYFNINTRTVWTDRGVHLYFKKPLGFKGASCVCALGFKIEYKHSGNTQSVTIKRDGIHRDVENEEIREELPQFFVWSKKFNELLGLDEGDGRNNSLFQHRIKIAGYNEEKRILNFINQYIFASPLPEEEFETIARNKEFATGKGTEYNVASKMIKDFKIHVYKQVVYYYDGVKYEADDLVLKNQLFKVIGEQKTAYIDEIVKQMIYRGKIVDIDSVFNVKLSNGVLKNGEFIEIDYKDFTPFYINIDYDVNTEVVKCVDNYINQLTDNDENYKMLLFEVLAHTLITDPEFKRMLAKFFIFVGDGGNGKGTLLQIIRKILNTKNCTGMKIKQLSDERYFSSLDGKLVNLGDDVQDQPINDRDMEMLKNISTCDYTEMRRLFKNSVSTTMTASLIFTSNHILKSWEKGESYKRRVMWLPMYTKPKKKDPKFITKLTSERALKYWLKLMVDGYKRLYQNGKFTSCSKVEEFNVKYHEDNNGALTFISDYKKENIIGKTGPELYSEFENWCIENEFTASKKMLKDAIQKKHGLILKVVKKGGKTMRIYQEIG